MSCSSIHSHPPQPPTQPGIQQFCTQNMVKELAKTGYQIPTHSDHPAQEEEMEVDSSQAPQHPPPAQALQSTTDQIQVMQMRYQEVVNTSGPDSQLAI
eukprot:492830-Karenia_brevis.AAC.1